jgi:hypothetical protein
MYLYDSATNQEEKKKIQREAAMEATSNDVAKKWKDLYPSYKTLSIKMSCMECREGLFVLRV